MSTPRDKPAVSPRHKAVASEMLRVGGRSSGKHENSAGQARGISTDKPRGISTNLPARADVFLEPTAIHYDQQPRVERALGGGAIDDTFL